MPGGISEQTAATYYSYDIHGNVNELLQDYNSGAMKATANRFKKIAYNYDLISGKVNTVSYQPNQTDAFYHRYGYDAENRITMVETSKDKIYWEKDARYNYYKHGPLARTTLGELQVQGIDYAYTLQGWLKGVNANSVEDGSFDIGEDGKVSSPNSLVARDAYGFSLNYFAADYKQINSSSNAFVSNSFSLTNTENKRTANPLYNGNIASMLVNIPKIGVAQLYGYTYDQLNRIKAMDAFIGFNGETNMFNPIASNNYKEAITYDANGNILTYKRNATAQRLMMDNMTYSYKPGKNQLDKVVDTAPDAASTEYDKYNDMKQGQVNENYQYDAIGNLTKDVSEGIDNIQWNVYGKIAGIQKLDGTNITYSYDASGNRISKQVAPASGTAKFTYYVRDASGNVMSVYSKDANINNNDLTQTEVHLYGSSRLGILNCNNNVQNIVTNPTGISNFIRGNKFFELSNHLGNVLVTISDKKIAVQGFFQCPPCDEPPCYACTPIPNRLVDYYTADVITANDYYPFGMVMPGRKFDAGSEYRYGFNGNESDNEVRGEGNALDFGDRSIYDPRLGRFISADPNYRSLPSYSPYQNARNNPIMLKENGQDGIIPKWLWRGGFIDPMAAGFIDAIGDDVKGLWGIAKAGMAFTPLNPWAWTSAAEKVRSETISTVKSVLTIMSNPVLKAIAIASIAEDAMSTVKNADFKDYQYAVGYASWNVLSFFVGVGEVATFAKTGKMSAGIEKFLGILSKSEGKINHLANIIKRASTHINKTEWHHIISNNLVNNPVVQAAIEDGYKFGDRLENLIPLEKFLYKNGSGVHGNAPKYDAQLKKAINKFEELNEKYTNKQAKAFLDDIKGQVIKRIDENPNTKINELDLKLEVKKY